MRAVQPKRPHKRRQTLAELRELHRLALSAIIRPLGTGRRTARRWTDGQPTARVAATFIKPNERLTSLERLEIYNRQYWFRLLECLCDDYPGLRAILGQRRFHDLSIAYLSKYPSRSFTLRNLGSRLEQFLREEPRWTRPWEAMCLDMARFEWAQIVAFDGAAHPPLRAEDLLGRSPANLRLGLQPYLTILDLQYPLDDFVLAAKKRNAALRDESSNALNAPHPERPTRRPRLPKARRVYLAVHRYENDLYYKRLTLAQHILLTQLRNGHTLEQACAAIEIEGDVASFSSALAEWFQNWVKLGWFCKRSNAVADSEKRATIKFQSCRRLPLCVLPGRW